ncbi:MAG: hypothetical protein NTY89_01030 [Nostocales cyanobacterium LacPavin_0920_SED1_MAG_38_18]|nr:hypothetical protein [Nostocales cyanobacterium LacPavin_0920_SED1_MAG_38_18]
MQQRFAIASHIPYNSELLAAALRYRTPIIEKRTACSSASLSHLPHPLTSPTLKQRTACSSAYAIAFPYPQKWYIPYPQSELLAAALRYRPLIFTKRFPRSDRSI